MDRERVHTYREKTELKLMNIPIQLEAIPSQTSSRQLSSGSHANYSN